MIPPIEPRIARGDAPFWSVMIPTLRTDPELLRRAIESVLDQGVGPREMQIEVVNDGDAADIANLAAKFGSRVTFHSNARNLGVPGNFTECVRRASGSWVHILHADDAVRPGFYDAYRAVIDRHPDCVLVGGQAIWLNERDEWIGVSPLVAADDGLLLNASATIAGLHPCNFASTVVARSAFEAAGGFDAGLVHANDWEMWTRLSTCGRVGWVAEPSAYYRRHAGSDTARLQGSSAYITDMRRAIAINAERFDDGATRRWVEQAANAVLSDYALGVAAGHLAQGRNRAAIRDATWGVRVRPNVSTIGRAGDTIMRALVGFARVRVSARRAGR